MSRAAEDMKCAWIVHDTSVEGARRRLSKTCDMELQWQEAGFQPPRAVLCDFHVPRAVVRAIHFGVLAGCGDEVLALRERVEPYSQSTAEARLDAGG